MNNNKLNILFLASWYPNKVLPSNGNFIEQHALAVSEKCNVYVLHIISRVQKEKFVVEQTLNNNILETIVYYKKVNSIFWGAKLLFKQNIRRKAHKLGFKAILKKNSAIDLIHLNVCFPAGIFALYLKRKYKIPYIISEHWTALLANSPTKLKPLEKYFVTRINRTAEIICPVSKDLKEALLKIAPKQAYTIIPNVVNTSIFKENITYRPSDKIKILHISNLKDEHKNVSGILNTIKKLSTVRNDFTITIVGSGESKHFKEKSKALEIPANIISFEKEKKRDEVAHAMNAHDLFLLFSNYETFSVVIAEALVCGLPIITSKCGGLTEEITIDNGIQVEMKNETQLFKKLDYLISNISKYDRHKIAADARKKYSHELVGKQFLSIYKNILGAQNR